MWFNNNKIIIKRQMKLILNRISKCVSDLIFVCSSKSSYIYNIFRKITIAFTILFVMLFLYSCEPDPFAALNERVESNDFRVEMSVGDITEEIAGTYNYTYVFHFQLNSRTLLGLRTDVPYNSKADTYAELFNTQGELIAADDNSGEGNNFFINKELEPGHYYLKIKDKSIISGGCIYPCRTYNTYRLYTYAAVYKEDGTRIVYLPGRLSQIRRFSPFNLKGRGYLLYVSQRKYLPGLVVDNNNFLYTNINNQGEYRLKRFIYRLPPVGNRDFNWNIGSPYTQNLNRKSMLFPPFGDKENNFYLYGDYGNDGLRHLIKYGNNKDFISQRYNYVLEYGYPDQRTSSTTAPPALGDNENFYTVDTEVKGTNYYNTECLEQEREEESCITYTALSNFVQILRSVNLNSGETLWSYNMGGSEYFQDEITSGTKVWGSNNRSSWYDYPGFLKVASIAIGNEGNIYLSSLNGLRAISSDGELLWHVLEGVETGKLAIGISGEILVPAKAKGLYAFHSNGTIKWHLSYNTDFKEGYNGLFKGLSVIGEDSSLYSIVYNGSSSALLAVHSNGSLRWKISDKFVSLIAANDGLIYAAIERRDNSYVHVINGTNGSLVKEYDLSGFTIGGFIAPVYLRGGLQDMVIDDGYLHILYHPFVNYGYLADKEIIRNRRVMLQSIPLPAGSRLAESSWPLANGNLRHTNNAADNELRQ